MKMKIDDLHSTFLEALEKKIPQKTRLVEILMDCLSIEKGAVIRRLRGEVPFSFFETVKIAIRLNISLNDVVQPGVAPIDHFALTIIEYTDMSEIYYKQWEEYIALIRTAKNDPDSEIAESSNILPLAVYAGFGSLSRFFIFKYQYLFSSSDNRKSLGDMAVPERLNQIFKSYFIESKYFAKTILIWDFMIFRYLITDIKFFSGINLIAANEIRQLKTDLFALLDYLEKMTLKGYFIETGNPVQVYISDINLDADYSYLQFNDIYISHVRSFILNSVASTDRSSFYKIKEWIHSIKRTSTLITQSGAVYRTDFFDKQRSMVSEL